MRARVACLCNYSWPHIFHLRAAPLRIPFFLHFFFSVRGAHTYLCGHDLRLFVFFSVHIPFDLRVDIIFFLSIPSTRRVDCIVEHVPSNISHCFDLVSSQYPVLRTILTSCNCLVQNDPPNPVTRDQSFNLQDSTPKHQFVHTTETNSSSRRSNAKSNIPQS